MGQLNGYIKKTIIACFSLIFISLSLWLAFSYFKTPAIINAAPIDPEFIGFAWSENIGWLSFSSKNCDPDNNGRSNGAPGCPSAGSPISQYAVSMAQNGNLYGLAWSERIGWIDFAPAGPYPSAPNQSVNLVFTGTANGWARVQLTDYTIWDGWIKFSTGGDYGSGVIFGGADGCTLQGYAWGSDVLGWINMSGTATDGSLYGVKIGCGTVSNLQIDSVTAPAACSASPQPAVSWTFEDFYGQPTQTAYQVQVSAVSDFSSRLHDSGQVLSSSNSYIISAGALAYGNSYYYRVRGWDGYNLPSPWTYSSLQAVPGHQGPLVDFYTVPLTALQGTTTTFSATVSAFGGATVSSYAWSFPSGTTVLTPLPSDQSENVILISQTNTVSLSVTDSDSLSCNITKSIKAVKPLREFKEVRP